MSARRAILLVPTLLLLVSGANSASAQTAVGVVGGVNLTNLRFDLHGNTNVTFERRNGLFGGVALTQSIPATYLSVEVDALLQQAGARALDGSVETNLTYFGVPVLLRYDLEVGPDRRLHFAGGPSFNFKVSEQLVAGVNESSDLQAVNGFDVQLVLGGGVDLGHIRLFARFARGLSNIIDSPDTGRLLVEEKNDGVMIGAGYTFGSR